MGKKIVENEQHRKNIEETAKIIRYMSQLMKSEQESVMDAISELSEIMGLLEKNILYAQEHENLELLRLLAHQIVPEFNQISRTIQDLRTTIIALTEHHLDRLTEEEGNVLALMPNTVVHVVMDRLGNAGDYILGQSMRQLIECESPWRPRWHIVHVACKITDDFIGACNQSRGVVIGGGGLFLRDSNVNEISGWQWPCSVDELNRIEVPVYVMGVGYNRFRGQDDFEPYFVESINALVEKSAFFGLRNHGSIRAIKTYLREELRDKVRFCPCATTVLSKLYVLPDRTCQKPFIAVNCAFDRPLFRYGDRQDEIMESIARVLKELSGDYQIRCYIQCVGDVKLLPYLEDVGVTYEKVDLVREMSEEEYLRYYTEPELVLAIRGHAQMIPFGCGTPVVSMISHDKLAWFLEDIGHPEWGIEVQDPDFEEKLLSLSRYMLENREQVCQQIAEAKEVLWDALQKSMEDIRL